MDSHIDKIESEIHKHLEIDKGDTTLTISVFDTPVIGGIEIDIHRTDNSGKLTFNSTKMFLTEEEFKNLAYFFQDIQGKISIRNSHKAIEDIRKEFIVEQERQIDFVESDTDHVNLNTPNLFRDIMGSTIIKDKMLASKSYCKKFYAAMCNTDVYKVGSTGEYGYSWRSAGGLIADILGEGDYLDWYCSGNEGYVDEEVADDLNDIGWIAIPMDIDDFDDKQGKIV